MAFPERVGRYEVQEVVGELLPATVLRARDSSNQRVRIHWYQGVRQPTLQWLARFGAVVERVKLAPQAGVLPILEWGVCDDAPFVVHPDVAATPVSALPENALGNVELLHDLACSLAKLHEAGCVHGWVWPGTVLVDRDNRVFLCHFGIDFFNGSLDYEVASSNLRALAFTAPEVMFGRVPGPASDAWSLAMMVWELLVGPLPNLSEARSMIAVMSRTRKPLALPAGHGLSGELAREVSAVLAAKEPDARGADAAERLARALAASRSVGV